MRTPAVKRCSRRDLRTVTSLPNERFGVRPRLAGTLRHRSRHFLREG